MATQSLPTARIAIFATGTCITADVTTSGERLNEVLNNQYPVLELTRITYSNPDRPGLPLIEFPTGSVRKSDITCVIVISETQQSTLRKIGTYVQKRPTEASIMVPDMVIIGTMHIQGRFDPTLMLSDPLEYFVPVTDACLLRSSSTTPGGIPNERYTMFVNKSRISGVLLSELLDAAPVQVEQVLPRYEHPTPLRPGTASLSGTPANGNTTQTHTGRLRRLVTTEFDR